MQKVTGYIRYEVMVHCPECDGTLDLADFPYDQGDDDELGLAVFGRDDAPAKWSDLDICYRCNHCKKDFILSEVTI